MSNFLPFYLFSFLRVFEPITSFKIFYYVKQKKFRNQDIYNKILPTFFYAGLFFSLITPFFIKYLSSALLMSGSSLSELMFITTIFLMPIQSKWVYLATIFNNMSAFMNSLSSAFLSKMIAKNADDEKKAHEIFGKCISIKNFGSVISSVIGQEVFLKLQLFEPILLLSFIGLFSCFISTLFVEKIDSKLQGLNLFKILKTGDFKQITSCYNRNVLFHSAVYVISGVTYVSFSMFAGSIFLERKKNAEVSPTLTKVIKYIFFPIRLLSMGFIKFYTIVFRPDLSHLEINEEAQNNTNSNNNDDEGDTKEENVKELDDEKKFNKEDENKKEEAEKDNGENKIIFGYIDSLAKISATSMAYLFSKLSIVTTTQQKIAGFILVILLLTSVFLMSRVRGLTQTYLIYAVGLAIAQTSMSLNKSAYYKHTKNKELVGSITILLENSVHITISTITRKFQMDVSRKMLCYFSICIPFFLAAIASF